MPTTITVDITGNTPYQVFLCENPIGTCVWIGQTSTSPYEFDIPFPLDEQTSYNIKVIDNNGCEKTYTVTV